MRSLYERLLRKPVRYKVLGNRALTVPAYDASLNKEEVSRQVLRARSGTFMEIGAGDRELRYLLGVRGNLEIDEAFYRDNKQWFDAQYSYVGTDLEHDICDPAFSAIHDASVDVAYSNNVFEHLRRPWIAAANIMRILRPGGIAITIVPFAQRYHAVPGDYFRFTHTGITSLFEDAGRVRVLVCGYDILGRRNDWQGGGEHDDIVPVDELGAWRETWFAVSIVEKI